MSLESTPFPPPDRRRFIPHPSSREESEKSPRPHAPSLEEFGVPYLPSKEDAGHLCGEAYGDQQSSCFSDEDMVICGAFDDFSLPLEKRALEPSPSLIPAQGVAYNRRKSTSPPSSRESLDLGGEISDEDMGFGCFSPPSTRSVVTLASVSPPSSGKESGLGGVSLAREYTCQRRPPKSPPLPKQAQRSSKRPVRPPSEALPPRVHPLRRVLSSEALPPLKLPPEPQQKSPPGASPEPCGVHPRRQATHPGESMSVGIRDSRSVVRETELTLFESRLPVSDAIVALPPRDAPNSKPVRLSARGSSSWTASLGQQRYSRPSQVPEEVCR